MKNEFDDKYITNEVKKYIDNIRTDYLTVCK